MNWRCSGLRTVLSACLLSITHETSLILNDVFLLPSAWNGRFSNAGATGRLGDNVAADGWVWRDFIPYPGNDHRSVDEYLQRRCGREMANVCPAASPDRSRCRGNHHDVGDGQASSGIVSMIWKSEGMEKFTR